MTTQQLAEMMGNMTSDREARAMQEILKERDITPDDVNDREWSELVADAVARATEVSQ